MALKKQLGNTALSVEMSQLFELRNQVEVQGKRLEKQSRMISALWELLKERLSCTNEDLEALMIQAQKNEEEAAGDSPAASGLTHCPRCEEPVKGERTSCFWCGHDFPQDLLSF